MHTILSLMGIVGSFFMIRFREAIGDIMGEGEWMKKIGGVYNLIIIVAVFIFFWSLAELTGTSNILLAPLTYLIPGLHNYDAAPQVTY